MKGIADSFIKIVTIVMVFFLPRFTFAFQLDGIWSVSLQGGSFGYGTLEYWEIGTSGNTLSIAIIDPLIAGAPTMGAMGVRPLNVYNARIDDTTASFSVESNSVTTDYTLKFINPNEARGFYRSINSMLTDLGAPPQVGTITEAGKVLIRRQQ